MTREEQRVYWKQIVDEQTASGSEASVFCRERNIKISQFYRWRKKFQNTGDEALTSRFIHLIPGDNKPSESRIRIRVFNDLIIEIDRGFDPLTLPTAMETFNWGRTKVTNLDD